MRNFTRACLLFAATGVFAKGGVLESIGLRRGQLYKTTRKLAVKNGFKAQAPTAPPAGAVPDKKFREVLCGESKCFTTLSGKKGEFELQLKRTRGELVLERF